MISIAVNLAWSSCRNPIGHDPEHARRGRRLTPFRIVFCQVAAVDSRQCGSGLRNRLSGPRTPYDGPVSRSGVEAERGPRCRREPSAWVEAGQEQAELIAFGVGEDVPLLPWLLQARQRIRSLVVAPVDAAIVWLVSQAVKTEAAHSHLPPSPLEGLPNCVTAHQLPSRPTNIRSSPAQLSRCSLRNGRTCGGTATVRLPTSVLGSASKATGDLYECNHLRG